MKLYIISQEIIKAVYNDQCIMNQAIGFNLNSAFCDAMQCNTMRAL